MFNIKRGDIVRNRSGNEYIVDGVVYLDNEPVEDDKQHPKAPKERRPSKSYFTIFSERAMQTLNGRYYEDALTSGLLTPTGKTCDNLEELESKVQEVRKAIRAENKKSTAAALALAGDSGGVNPEPKDPVLEAVKAGVAKMGPAKPAKKDDTPVPPDCPDCALIWNENGGECKLCHYVPKVSKFTPLNTLIRLHSAKHHKRGHA